MSQGDARVIPAKDLIAFMARKTLPMSLRNVIRPHWQNIVGTSDKAVRAREIAKVGPAKRWERTEFQEQEQALLATKASGFAYVQSFHRMEKRPLRSTQVP